MPDPLTQHIAGGDMRNIPGIFEQLGLGAFPRTGGAEQDNAAAPPPGGRLGTNAYQNVAAAPADPPGTRRESFVVAHDQLRLDLVDGSIATPTTISSEVPPK